MFDPSYLVVLLTVSILIGLIPAAVAHSKGRDFLAWWIFGTLLFIIALPLAIIDSPDTAVLEKRQIEQGKRKKCPYCAEIIKVDAQVCKHCGRDLPVAAQEVRALTLDEERRREKIQQAYRSHGWCEVCGERLGWMTKLRGETRCGKHR